MSALTSLEKIPPRTLSVTSFDKTSLSLSRPPDSFSLGGLGCEEPPLGSWPLSENGERGDLDLSSPSPEPPTSSISIAAGMLC